MKKGFTLIELLVVVLIIGILSAIALPQYQKAVDKAHAAEALTTISSLRQSIEEYILSNGTFPTSYEQLTVIPSGTLGKYSVENDKIQGKYYTCVIISGRIDCGNGLGGGFVWLSDFSSWYTPLGGQKRLWCYVVEGNAYSTDKKEQARSLCKAITGISTGIEYAGDSWYSLD